jgi:hypothetical protein
MDAHDILGWVQASKAAVDLLKSAYSALPTGEKRTEVENKVRVAEQILERSDSKLAEELGFTLCKCTWPAQIMLWNEHEKAEICPRPECGHRRSKGPGSVGTLSTPGPWSRSR